MLAATLAGTCAHACARRCSDGSACHDCMFASQFTTRTLIVHDESSRMEVNVGEGFRLSRACLMRFPGMPSEPVNPIPRLAVSPDRQKTGRHLPSASGGHLVTCKDVQDAVWGKLRLSRCAKSLVAVAGHGWRVWKRGQGTILEFGGTEADILPGPIIRKSFPGPTPGRPRDQGNLRRGSGAPRCRRRR